MSKNFSLGTIAVQGGYKPNPGEPRVLPIFQSTSYQQGDPDHVAKLFGLEAEGHLYTRISNPTIAAYEEKYAALQGGVAAVATSSGQAAIFYAIANIAKAGDHIISTSALYGGTFNLFNINLRKFGIEVTFVDPEASEEEILALAKENTKAIYGEIIGNPGLNILDLDKFSRVAKKIGVPLIVDNTVPSPYLCNPFEFGANVVVHSTTKYSDGHAVAVGGIIVDGGNFDWANGKFPEFTEPDSSYHGIKYIEAFGKAAYAVKARVTLLRDLGAAPSPFNAFLTNLGLETLHLRMERHSLNALKLAEFLGAHPKVAWVNYPYLEGNSQYERAQKYLKGGASGVLTFGIKGGLEEGKKLIKNLEIATLVVNLGDARTYILHPASTTHAQLSEEEQKASGVSPDLLRISVGIEDTEDLIRDFEQALNSL
ncbi:O-acetylhomoserine aminocarboxypropyltransferase/cysteine synthase family protein [Clostridium paridis]|uniref:O-acetylhomoserine aminocarboxypropyltransferase/cysteine synthase n=1 Tax=Clostridium paridis TaxID=2803863 RepID=A0A937FKE8_9CLOT|nr:O-acetylhomoserine aminocarboxypropyltransferase/cysteine synthase family protein [Clostridium paridis]MBL4933426.1 O-acetylhomoserine aminocarboxypropyltransferase/cysteine synthase [Clostridium paridis]